MNTMWAYLFFAPIYLAAGQELSPSSSPEIVATSSVARDYSVQLDEFADIVFRKYTTENPTRLSSSEFTHFWATVFASRNVSVRGLPASTSQFIPSACDKNLGTHSPFCKAVTECTGSKQLYEIATRNGKTPLDGSTLKEVCPLMLYQLESGMCDGVILDSDGKPEIKVADLKKKPSQTEVWLYGIGFVTIISACSLVGVSVLPLMGKAFYAKLLTVMVGLAVGSLSGSSVFHLIPQAFGLPDSDPEHGYLQTSFLLWAGIWLFFMIERFLKIIMDAKQRNNQQNNPTQTKNSWPLVECKHSRPHPSQSIQQRLLTEKNSPKTAEQGNELCAGTEIERIYESQEQAIKASFGHQAKPQRNHSHERIIHFKSGDSPIQSVAWMIIFGDGFHNFIDGLSLGAAFNESITTGISISVAVMCEELPHELGDFAVLLSSGMTMRQALLYNFLSACTCYFGLALGIVLGEFEASKYIFAVAGGMFLYISLVDMVPEMNEVAEEASSVSVSEALKVLTLQNVGIIFGVGTLFVLAKFQDQIRFG